VGDLDSQCVIVTLAHICNVQASEFLQAGVRQARNFLAALGPLGEWLSTEELGGRRSAHDLLLEKSHDFFMLRTFFLELFAAKRLVFVNVTDTGTPVQVQVLNAPAWNSRAPGAGTYFILIARGHANTLGVPIRYGNFTPGEAVPYANAQAVLRHLRQYAKVEYYNTVTVQDLREKVPRTLPKKALSACQCGCGELLQLGPSQRAAGVAHVRHGYVAKAVVNGGLKRENFEEAYGGRGGDCQEGWEYDGIGAHSGQPAAPESSNVVTHGRALPRKSAVQRDSMSYKAALCNGLRAVSSNGVACVAQPRSAQSAAAMGGGSAPAASGSTRAAWRGGSAREGGKHLSAQSAAAVGCRTAQSAAAMGGGSAPAASGSTRAAWRGGSAREGGKHRSDQSAAAVGCRTAQSAAAMGGGSAPAASGSTRVAWRGGSARKDGGSRPAAEHNADGCLNRWHGTLNHAKSGYGGEKGSEGGGEPPSPVAGASERISCERDCGEALGPGENPRA